MLPFSNKTSFFHIHIAREKINVSFIYSTHTHLNVHIALLCIYLICPNLRHISVLIQEQVYLSFITDNVFPQYCTHISPSKLHFSVIKMQEFYINYIFHTFLHISYLPKLHPHEGLIFTKLLFKIVSWITLHFETLKSDPDYNHL